MRRTGRPRRAERAPRPEPRSERPCSCSEKPTPHVGRYVPALGDMIWTCEACERPKMPASASRFDEALISRLALCIEVDAGADLGDLEIDDWDDEDLDDE